MNLQERLARQDLAILEKAIDIDKLVVQSTQPFGNLINNETREVYVDWSSGKVPEFIYALCGMPKALKWALAEIDSLRSKLNNKEKTMSEIEIHDEAVEKVLGEDALELPEFLDRRNEPVIETFEEGEEGFIQAAEDVE